MSRVVCAGHVNWDVTLQVDRLPVPDDEASIEQQYQAGGGSASNAAAVFSGLDVSTALLGSVGTDEYGWLAERELEEVGVESHVVQAQGDTTVKYLVVADDGEVMVFGNDGANEAFTADDLPETALAGADHLHLTGQSPETAAALAERAGDRAIEVSFDPGRRLGERDYSATLDRVDVLFLNAREVELASEAGLLPAAADLLVKHGSGGAELRTDSRSVSHPGFIVDPVDTSGSGDAFDAGFIAARLDGNDDERALAIANACGALAARSVGARCHVGWDDVYALLDIGPAE